mgnify:CR=1 FL=1
MLQLSDIFINESKLLRFALTGSESAKWDRDNLSRDDLASMVGTAREHVVRVLSEFKDEKILETRGRKIIVLDVNKLIRIADLK